MKFVSRVIVCGLIALEACLVNAQQWPGSPDPYPPGSKIDKPTYATIDITDDMWRSQSRFSREGMVSLMQYLARLDISRVYWMRTPEYISSDWMFPHQGTVADAEQNVVRAAHDAGLECFAIFKPFETGLVTGFLPQTCSIPAQVQTIEIQSGRLPWVAPFVIHHPEYRIERKPLQVDPNQSVTMIKLVKSDNAITGLKASNLEIWTSHDNGNFARWNDSFAFRDSCEMRDGQSVRVLTLSNLSIPPDQRYIMVRAVAIADEASKPFSNIPAKLMELYGENGNHIPSNGDDGVVPRSVLTQTIALLCIRLYGKGDVPSSMVLSDSYGKSLEASSFDFGHAGSLIYGSSPPSERKLESSDGYIVAAKGKDMFMPSPHPIYPEVRAYWMGEIQTLLEHGFDGIDLRIDNHSTWMIDSEEYGFNQPVIAAYKEKYDIDILNEKFDPDCWQSIQGDSYTQFVKEAHELTRSCNRPLHIHVSGVWANATPGFDLNNLPKNFNWQWKQWIAEDLCDGVHLKLLPWPWGSYRGKGQDFAVEAIVLAHRYGKSVSADARIGMTKLVTTEKEPGQLTADDVREVIDSLTWAWRSQSVDAINLYETLDFVYLDPAADKTYGSPAFEQILDAVRNNRENALPKTNLQNWISREIPKTQ